MILRSMVAEGRRRAGLTQAALAERAGVAQSTALSGPVSRNRRWRATPMAGAEFDPERMLAVLGAAEVRCVLIGGMAAV